jgi:HK97 family phage major capsid protein
VVENEACPLGFALVGDFRRAILWDRESVQISVGTANEDFIRNLVRVLAEIRVGFGVVRPAFVEVDLVA